MPDPSTINPPPTDHDRLGGVDRLYGKGSLDCLRAAHVWVIGIGGVGSWAAEALARTGIGRLTLVDLDDICLTNTNRQVHALDGAYGRPKIDVMAERIQAIRPDIRVDRQAAFVTSSNVADVLAPGPDLVLDAIDGTTNKAHLIAHCRDHAISLVTMGGAGGRRDPGRVLTCDLAFTRQDKMLAALRKRLRQRHGFPPDSPGGYGIACVHSQEPPVYPWRDGSVCAEREPGTPDGINCESGFGTSVMVTATFGFHAAAAAVNRLLQT
ncbi:MAG: tRNA threonylcarbamoyladenosine dehydratase [Opitutales bacterium]